MDMSTTKQRKEAENYKNIMRRLSPKYSQYFLFAYADSADPFLKEHKITVKKIPGGIITFRDGSVIEYPADWPLDDKNIDRFLEMVLRQTINKTESTTFQPDYDKPVYKEMTAVNILRNINFNFTILESGKNVLIFFFESFNDSYE